MNLLKSSRGTKFLAAGAAVAAIGMGTGGWAFASSSGHAPTLIPAGPPVIKVLPAGPAIKVLPGRPIRVHPAGGRNDGCSGLTLTPVSGIPAPPVQGTENPTPVPGTPVVCGDGGTTAG